jgi:hypothetical protein
VVWWGRRGHLVLCLGHCNRDVHLSHLTSPGKACCHPLLLPSPPLPARNQGISKGTWHLAWVD